jgi:hypothetical protein
MKSCFATAVAKPAVSKWRVKGEGVGGVTPSAGDPRLCPQKKIQITDASR